MSSSSNNIESELQARLGAVANDNNADASAAIAAASAAAAAAAAARDHQQQQPAAQAHGYSDIQPANNTAVDQTLLHPSLRAAPATTLVPTANMMPTPATNTPGEAPPASAAPGPVNPVLAAANLAHVAPAPAAPGADEAQQSPSDGRRAKRELSQSKRAAQNRAAQRAFRQRKEGYIKKLEAQVKDYESMEKSYKSLQQENYQLRDYIIMLQARLMDLHLECPPPPASLNLQNPPQHQQHQQQPINNVTEAPRDTTGSALEAIAQAVAGIPPAENTGYIKQEQQQQQQQAQQQQNEDVTMKDEVASQLRNEVPRQS